MNVILEHRLYLERQRRAESELEEHDRSRCPGCGKVDECSSRSSSSFCLECEREAVAGIVAGAA